jgi:hypothetical protein
MVITAIGTNYSRRLFLGPRRTTIPAVVNPTVALPTGRNVGSVIRLPLPIPTLAVAEYHISGLFKLYGFYAEKFIATAQDLVGFSKSATHCWKRNLKIVSKLVL